MKSFIRSRAALWRSRATGSITLTRDAGPHCCFFTANNEERSVSGDATKRVRDAVDSVYRSESRRVFATLIRLLGDFDLAEEALHDAFRAALEQWPRDGVPENPRAWLISAGRFKAIDGIPRRGGGAAGGRGAPRGGGPAR